MARTSKSQNHHIHPEEEDDDTEDVAAGTDTSSHRGISHRDGKGAEQKSNNHRSKHSETEQRRRSKINERFQILKDLIPPNDQKRDKASLLLEVIEYIQFLQEKLQVYEGSYQQVWGTEPTKLVPWRGNHGPGDNLTHPSLAMINGSVDAINETQAVTNLQRSVEPEFSRDFAYNRGIEHPTGQPMPAVPLNMPLNLCAYLPGRSILSTENFAPKPPSSSVVECATVGNEGGTLESGSSSVSRIYSQVLLKKLSRSLEMSGVDMSQANISVELDLASGSTSGASASILCPKEVGNQPRTQPEDLSGKEEVYPATKRMRSGES